MTGHAPPVTGTAVRPVVTGVGVLSAAGTGLGALAEAAAHGKAAFTTVTRFDVSARRTTRAALLPEPTGLADAVLDAVDQACRQAGLPAGATEHAGATALADPTGDAGPGDPGMPVLLALHSDLRTRAVTTAVATGAAAVWGVPGVTRVYTGACVAAGTAVADAAALVAAGRHPRVLVAAGHLVEPGVFAAFDAGRALSRDGELRPFSAGRTGTLLGDAAAAVVVEAEPAAERRGATVLARLAGWGRTGDAHHVCRPEPDGGGAARAVQAALARAGVGPAEIGYVNANGTGSPLADRAEASALRRVFGAHAERLPVSSSKSVHGHALEASALLELAVTIATLSDGRLPVNAGWLGPDPDVGLDLVLDGPRTAGPRYALTLNSAFGGANTALLVAAR
ncbi:beta-ketoacyl synthase N-terminal-like domain-containing protein [Streptomyces sp. CB01881]|uniref:beta-ketoacyl synthase N-terminal-like domain-containing protein n=1 Tax=Streptomyces sp. CB01881 TaxID=2078691 RepID=UPI000CDC5F2B|nr:beta-ketoacyl synthase N-terminal-like domain-containing protein [Streptomyces sp. CB01881]AUY47996.1 3-ketoacyl-ACP synthase [Streptomyces sp. CB01881]TYC76476.1 beta-ketoacyl-[acyl-carrier-protein] synthase family protein [Streptomyces sp. CB01881]